ncbi:MAG: 16S rRNA (cytosine(1402)-N(4))-methyltransferase RsmH [Candidatus Nealsonbacteria bacterium]
MHVPVLQKEVIKYLDPKPGENFIDCTFGQGGHSLAILGKNAPNGKILGIDLCLTLKVKHPRAVLVQDNFANLTDIVRQNKIGKVDGILFDLGYSSWHLEESGRGFSFQKKEPLDMRYNLQNQLTAEKIVNFWSKFEIERVLREYGEEKRAGKIAAKIIEARIQKPIKNTAHLTEIINKAGAAPRLTFQALRIAVNDELNNIEKALPQALQILEHGGRIVVISFHSLEDRIVKNFLKNNSLNLNILTKKPTVPERQEIIINNKSRSAKLRAAIKI